MDLRCDNNDWIWSLEEDGIIDKAQLDELLCINSYINFIQEITGPIVDGYADITKCTRDDFLYFVNFTKWYYGEEASEPRNVGQYHCLDWPPFYQHMAMVCYRRYKYQTCMYGLPIYTNNDSSDIKVDNNNALNEETSVPSKLYRMGIIIWTVVGEIVMILCQLQRTIRVVF